MSDGSNLVSVLLILFIDLVVFVLLIGFGLSYLGEVKFGLQVLDLLILELLILVQNVVDVVYFIVVSLSDSFNLVDEYDVVINFLVYLMMFLDVDFDELMMVYVFFSFVFVNVVYDEGIVIVGFFVYQVYGEKLSFVDIIKSFIE